MNSEAGNKREAKNICIICIVNCAYEVNLSKKLKKNTKQYFWIIFTILLTACGNISSELDTNTAPTSMSVFTPIVQIPTELPTKTPVVPSLTSVPGTLFPLDGLRMAYVIDGNLYLQDGNNPPIQLTNNGQDHSPIFSDDGEKVIFFRGLVSHDVYSINANGSQERALVTSSLLTALDLGYDDSTEIRSLAFVPGTHQLLFNTHEFKPKGLELEDMNRLGAQPNQDLLLIDTDTAEIKVLQDSGRGGIFQVSPDGKLVGIQAINHVDVIGIGSNFIHKNLATYPTAWLYNRKPDVYWTQDSRELSVVLPIETENALDATGPEPRTIWQYSMDGGPAVEIRLFSPPIGNSFNISPDGDWVVYTYDYYPGKTDETVTPGIYIGNLRAGSSQLVETAGLYGLPYSFNWSPDSVHFVLVGIQSQFFLGNVSGEITPLTEGRFLGWIDESRYLYLAGKIFLGEIGKETNLIVANIPASIKYINPDYFTFVFVKREVREEK